MGAEQVLYTIKTLRESCDAWSECWTVLRCSRGSVMNLEYRVSVMLGTWLKQQMSGMLSSFFSYFATCEESIHPHPATGGVGTARLKDPISSSTTGT